jgi:phosphatidylglycerophosphatase A
MSQDRAPGAGIQGAARPWPEVFSEARVPALVATWFGVGFLPVAPGTWGSLAAIPLVHAVYLLTGLAGLVAFTLAVSAIGFHAAGETARIRRIGDPSEIVVDEVAGQSIALTLLYAAFPRAPSGLLFWSLVLLSFFAFRVVDVVKPGPVGWLERLPGGIGIMCDDLLGGLLVGAAVAGALLVARL